jgi:hypothetical protein
LRQQAAGLFGQIEQDGARLKNGKVVLGAIDDGRNATVGVDRQEPGLLRLALRQIQRVRRVGQREFLQAMEILCPLGVAAVYRSIIGLNSRAGAMGWVGPQERGGRQRILPQSPGSGEARKGKA